MTTVEHLDAVYKQLSRHMENAVASIAASIHLPIAGYYRGRRDAFHAALAVIFVEMDSVTRGASDENA